MQILKWLKAGTAELPLPASSVPEMANAFALDLYSRLQATPGNLLFSPYSLFVALTMAYAGARGDTQRQMAQALHVPVDHQRLLPAIRQLQTALAQTCRAGDASLSIACSLWPDRAYPLTREYLSLITQNYGASLTPVDYRNAADAARAIINDWVAAKTDQRITDLIPPGILNHLTRLVLVNAIHFKGKWAQPFESSETTVEDFWSSPQQPTPVHMMHQTQELPYTTTDKVQILELPYAGNGLSMLVVLPQTRDGLSKLERSLTVAEIRQWISALSPTTVNVSLPRFTMECRVNPKDPLIAAGMVDAFDPERADLSGMDGTRLLHIAEVLHQAMVIVNEQGTEAAAATAMDVALKGWSEPEHADFVADHPFLFLIRENATGCILFIGRVMDPHTPADHPT